MTVAVADASAAKASPPPSVPAPDCAAVKALTYLCLASLWVGGAGVAAAAFIDLDTAGAAAYGTGFPVFGALLKPSTDAVLFGALLALVALLLLLRAAFGLVVADLRVGMGTDGISKMPRESMGSMLRDTAVIGWLASLPFILLSFVGCLVLTVLSPAKGSLTA